MLGLLQDTASTHMIRKCCLIKNNVRPCCLQEIVSVKGVATRSGVSCFSHAAQQLPTFFTLDYYCYVFLPSFPPLRSECGVPSEAPRLPCCRLHRSPTSFSLFTDNKGVVTASLS